MSNPPNSNPSAPGWSRWIERLRAVTAGRFTIIRELGRGGFAVVFLAQQLKPSRRVAIKLLLPSHLDSQWALDHFRGESQKIAEWRHQSVITIYEVHEVDELFFFVMSYVEGASLHDLIQSSGRMSVSMTRSVLAQTGSALQYAHTRGVTHRDIKPQNVLIDTDGGAVVTDFGIAKQAGGKSHTVTGMIFGTPPYMAPEQCETSTTSEFSDQYALGIMAYEMLTGSPPFTGAAMQVLIAHMQDPVPALRTIRPDCPPELEAAVARMLEKDPAKRFPNVAEAMQAAGAVELPPIDPERQKFSAAARDVSSKMSSQIIDIVSIPPQIEVGDKIAIESGARTIAGDPITAGTVKWSMEAGGSAAKFDEASGTLVAMQPGSATLLVRGANGVDQQVRVDVVAARAATISVRAPTKALRIGDRTKLSATAVSKHGLPVSSNPVWSSDDPKLATISADGVLQAMGVGRTRVRAKIDEVTSEFWIDVAAPTASEIRITGLQSAMTINDQRQLTAVVLDSADHVMTDQPVQWTSSDRNVATVSPQGLVITRAAGSVTITAALDDHTATFDLMVQQRQASHVELHKPPPHVNVGDRVRLRAIARDADGTEIDRPITWATDDAAIAKIGADGTLEAIASGAVRVSATIDGVTASTALDVTRHTKQVGRAGTPAIAGAAVPAKKSGSGKMAGIGIAVVALAAGGIYFATRGPSEPSTTPTSTSSVAQAPPQQAKQDSVTPPKAEPPPTTPAPKTGVSTPPAGRASAAGTAKPKVSVQMLGAPRELTVGDDHRVSVTVENAPATSIQWTSSDESKALVTSTGLVQARAPGRVTIIARSGDVADSASFDIKAKAVVPAPQTQSAPPPVTTPPPKDPDPPAGRSTAPAAPDKATLERPVRQLVADYAAALSSKRMADVKRLNPNIPANEEKGYVDLFGYLSKEPLRVAYNVDNIAFGRGTATANVSGEQSYTNPQGRKLCKAQVTLTFAFTESAGSWQISKVTPVSNSGGGC